MNIRKKSSHSIDDSAFKILSRADTILFFQKNVLHAKESMSYNLTHES